MRTDQTAQSSMIRYIYEESLNRVPIRGIGERGNRARKKYVTIILGFPKYVYMFSVGDVAGTDDHTHTKRAAATYASKLGKLMKASEGNMAIYTPTKFISIARLSVNLLSSLIA